MAQKLLCEVMEVQDHGEHVYSVFLQPASPAPRFLAGQFLHLALDPYEPGDFWPESRVFSIASPPAQRSLLRITYAVKGNFTSRMEAELRPGREVWIKMPYGEFIIAGGEVCLLAGGTGMTAFTAFLAGLPADYPQSIHLFYGARRPDLLIYRSLVEEAAERCPRLHPTFTAEQDPGATCLPGRLSPPLVMDTLPDPFALTYYLAGPPAMLDVFTRDLHQRGVDANCMRVDAWE